MIATRKAEPDLVCVDLVSRPLVCRSAGDEELFAGKRQEEGCPEVHHPQRTLDGWHHRSGADRNDLVVAAGNSEFRRGLT